MSRSSMQRGEKGPGVKLTLGQVQYVRDELERASRGRQASLARELGVSRATITRIKQGLAWSEAPTETAYEKLLAMADTDQDQCVLWTGGTVDGYPRVCVSGRTHRGNRIVVAYFLGIPIEEVGVACHTCDTPLCINRHHIYNGTWATNAQDRDNRGRGGGGRPRKEVTTS